MARTVYIARRLSKRSLLTGRFFVFCITCLLIVVMPIGTTVASLVTPAMLEMYEMCEMPERLVILVIRAMFEIPVTLGILAIAGIPEI